jgi:hypothetical protein
MRAKKVYESITDIFVPKTEDEILQGLSTTSIQNYIDKKEDYKSELRGKPFKYDPLIVKLFYELKERGYPVHDLHGERMAAGMGMSVPGGEFKLTVEDKDGTKHRMTIYQKDKTFITGQGDVPMDWVSVMSYDGVGIGHVGGKIRNIDELIEVIKQKENHEKYSAYKEYMKRKENKE